LALGIHSEESATMNRTLNLTTKERQRYSLTRLCSAMAAGSALRGAGFEMECHVALCKKYGVEPQRAGVFVPDDVLLAKRDMTVAGVSGSNYLVGVDVQPFYQALREVSWLERLPVQRLPDLQADQTIPRHGSNVAVTWLGSEGAVITERDPAVGSVTLAPKNVAIIVERSHQHMVQGSRNDAALSASWAESRRGNRNGLHSGSGADGQPTGAPISGQPKRQRHDVELDQHRRIDPAG
jgi:hypothetical protein